MGIQMQDEGTADYPNQKTTTIADLDLISMLTFRIVDDLGTIFENILILHLPVFGKPGYPVGMYAAQILDFDAILDGIMDAEVYPRGYFQWFLVPGHLNCDRKFLECLFACD